MTPGIAVAVAAIWFAISVAVALILGALIQRGRRGWADEADAWTSQLPCVCGHPEMAHQHFRAGQDCGFSSCGCDQYRAAKRLKTVVNEHVQ